jgi:hypothetical protein
MMSSPTKPPTEKAKLEWELVISTRRCWTALSVMILAAVGSVLLGRLAGGPVQRGLALSLAGVTVAAAAVWFRAQQLVLRLHRSLERRVAWRQHLLRS